MYTHMKVEKDFGDFDERLRVRKGDYAKVWVKSHIEMNHTIYTYEPCVTT